MYFRNDRRVRNKPQIDLSNTIPISDNALVKLNSRVKHKTQAVSNIVERQVDKYLMTLDEDDRKNLSKSQISRSREKVYLWEKSNSNYIENVSTVPEDYLAEDKDPSIYGKTGKPVRARWCMPHREQFRQVLDCATFESRFVPISPDLIRNIPKKERSPTKWIKRRGSTCLLIFRIEKTRTSRLYQYQNLSKRELYDAYKIKDDEMQNKNVEEAFNFEGTHNVDLSINELIHMYLEEVKDFEGEPNDFYYKYIR